MSDTTDSIAWTTPVRRAIGRLLEEVTTAVVIYRINEQQHGVEVIAIEQPDHASINDPAEVAA